MNSIGNNIKLMFFGESHAKYIGVSIDNLPAGIKINKEMIDFNLKKRRPGSNISTARQEDDRYEIISGVLDDITTGAPVTFLIENKDVRPDNYEDIRYVPRPSHSDYPAYIKYEGFNDYRGGGVFSGRLTALWVIVGSIAEQLLTRKSILVGSHIKSIKNIEDDSFDYLNIDDSTILDLNQLIFPILNDEKKQEFLDLIDSTRKNLDSVGGVVESAIINLPVGLGEPLFLSVEGYISQLLYSVPGVKGVEFGSGFMISQKYGSEANDEYEFDNGKLKLLSNNNGGILGGITNGAPIIVRCAVKPTPSIGAAQKSVNLKSKENVSLKIKGRHDPQIVSRVVHVINSVLNFAVLDLLLYRISKDELL